MFDSSRNLASMHRWAPPPSRALQLCSNRSRKGWLGKASSKSSSTVLQSKSKPSPRTRSLPQSACKQVCLLRRRSFHGFQLGCLPSLKKYRILATCFVLETTQNGLGAAQGRLKLISRPSQGPLEKTGFHDRLEIASWNF